MREIIPLAQGEVRELIAQIDALTGLVAAMEPSKFNVRVTDEENAHYRCLTGHIDRLFARVREAGFPLSHMNRHPTLQGYRAWAISRGRDWGGRRALATQPFEEVLPELRALDEALGRNPVAPLEVLREMQEAARRTDEVFIVMAVRAETTEFLDRAIRPAVAAAQLRDVYIAQQDPEQAISEAILSSIRRSIIVICDLTFERPNCYFEAGYAKGAFRRLIFTARKDHDIRAHPGAANRVHFDVDQFRITWWDPSNWAVAQAELAERLQQIRGQIG
jgi:hypothetical protein